MSISMYFIEEWSNKHNLGILDVVPFYDFFFSIILISIRNNSASYSISYFPFGKSEYILKRFYFDKGDCEII